jgi:predicted transcriptional regulator
MRPKVLEHTLSMIWLQTKAGFFLAMPVCSSKSATQYLTRRLFGRIQMDNTPIDATNLLDFTADIVSAHVANNSVAIGDLPGLITSVHTSLAGLGMAKKPDVPVQEPAVPIRRSVKSDHIVCLEDGKKLKMLKRHLMTHYQLTPDQYRAKWNLPGDYPMVAPDYAEKRRALAMQIGLGRKPGSKVAPKSAPKKVGRPRKNPPVAPAR